MKFRKTHPGTGRNGSSVRYTLYCPFCGVQFVADDRRTVYCSKKHYMRQWQAWHKLLVTSPIELQEEMARG